MGWATRGGNGDRLTEGEAKQSAERGRQSCGLTSPSLALWSCMQTDFHPERIHSVIAARRTTELNLTLSHHLRPLHYLT